MGVDLALVPVGITFPSAKESDEESTFHTCQLLALADYDWFEKHALVDPEGYEKVRARASARPSTSARASEAAAALVPAPPPPLLPPTPSLLPLSSSLTPPPSL